MKRLRWGGGFVIASTLYVAACGAVYPEVATPLKPVAPGRALEAPPDDVLYLEVKHAKIPQLTRDGRKWDAIGDAAPDAFLLLILDGREIFRTPVQPDTLEPTWPEQPRGNYRVPLAAKLRLEIWDSNPVNNYPICTKWLGDLRSELASGETTLDLRCDSGAQVDFVVGPAHPNVGLGFFYELFTGGTNITRVYSESPAAKAGLQAGDHVLEIMGKKVGEMETGEAQSLINANAQTGVQLKVHHPNGKEETVTVKEGAIYALVKEQGRKPGSD